MKFQLSKKWKKHGLDQRMMTPEGLEPKSSNQRVQFNYSEKKIFAFYPPKKRVTALYRRIIGGLSAMMI